MRHVAAWFKGKDKKKHALRGESDYDFAQRLFLELNGARHHMDEVHNCPVCCEPIDFRPERCDCVGVNHVFHRECLSGWRSHCKKHGRPLTCPVSRTPLR